MTEPERNDSDAGFNQWKSTGEHITPTSAGASEPRPQVDLLTTTPGVEGHVIRRHLGLVFGESGVGAGVATSIGQTFQSFLGERTTGTETRLRDARNLALREMSEQAAALGANAVVGVRVDQEPLSNGSIILVLASGTAVQVETR